VSRSVSKTMLLERVPREAHEPPELREGSRDAVRLLVSMAGVDHRGEHHHSRFINLANFLEPRDLLVVNRSATLNASLEAEGRLGRFVLNLSTDYGGGVWLAEPRWSFYRPGPLPLETGETFTVAGLSATLLHPYPGLERLWFVHFDGDVGAVMVQHGLPIRYGYVDTAFPVESYQTIFSDRPGSAEMPAAARPFSERVLRCLEAKGVGLATVTLHTGVSSLDASGTLYPEPFVVPAATVAAIAATKAAGGRIIAVGTTVVRAVESAFYGGALHATQGFTRLYLRPGRAVNVVDGLLTGFHAPEASHLEMLYAVAGEALVRGAYAEAVREGYLWHEFGDSHLILPEPRRNREGRR
jgi:S-adenosylmethionine:tRNA ribosyltransferase-isomerase